MTIHFRNIMQCPKCGFKTTESMPREKKVLSYICPACNLITEKNSDTCCIFCQLGKYLCPEHQMSNQSAEK